MAKINRQDIWVIIPSYNESKYLANVLKKIRHVTTNVIVVDDGSSDETAKIAQRYLKHVLVHLTNLGKGAALKTGCEYAFNELGAKAVIFMDGDDQHDPQDLEKFYRALQEHSVVFGERGLDHHMPLVRIVGNRLSSVIIMVLFGRYIPDILSGFKALRKGAYQQVQWTSRDYSVEMEIAARVAKNKLNIKIVPVETIYHDMDRGMNFLDILQIGKKLISWKLTI